jgi:zinc protease
MTIFLRPLLSFRLPFILFGILMSTPSTAAENKITDASNTPPSSPMHFGAGPSGSLLLVEENHTLPVISVVLAARSGSASDPEKFEGLSNLAAEIARRGAAGMNRTALDNKLDDLGANLDAIVDADSARFVGRVLARNFDAFMDLLADVVLRPSFEVTEVERSRREMKSIIAESRNDDRSLCERNFSLRLFGRHPYGQAPDGSEASIDRISLPQIKQHFHRQFSGKNVIFGAAGDITIDTFSKAVNARFGELPEGKDLTLRSPTALAPQGWRIQVVDKPDRQQVQIMFGHLAIPATHPDYIALLIGMTSFGGHAMNATLMAEVRTKRGWAYGAYMNAIPHPILSVLRGWVFTGVENAVDTLKLVLRLYGKLANKPLTDGTISFFQKFLSGSYGADLDTPGARLARRIAGEIQGLPRDFIDTFADRVHATTTDAVRSALAKHLHPKDLAITLVATASVLVPKLKAAGIKESAIDVTPYTIH